MECIKYMYITFICFSELSFLYSFICVFLFCRCGFAGEMGPRYIIASQVKIRTGQVRKVNFTDDL